MNTIVFKKETAGYRAAELLVKLHDLSVAGMSESSEDDEARDALEAIWYELSQEEQSILNGLSADLYMLEGKELFEDATKEQRDSIGLLLLVKEAYEAQAWHQVLSLLRKGPAHAPLAEVAGLRGRSYFECGMPLAAARFCDFAFKLDPARLEYAEHAIFALLKSNQISEVKDRMQRMLSDPKIDSQMLLEIGICASGFAEKAIPLVARDLWKKVVDAISEGLKRLPVQRSREQESIMRDAMFILAVSHERLYQLEHPQPATTPSQDFIKPIIESVQIRQASRSHLVPAFSAA